MHATAHRRTSLKNTLPIASIRVDKRHRKTLGDIAELARSMA
jgi:hypothetical protein